jgi:prepilin-type N-terminal cleavage/methylation domain-containing protein
MKKEFPISDFRFPIERRGRVSRFKSIGNRQSAIGNARGFTMVEIAISLAVIGIGLVAIIGVLPIGMNTQRDNREETIINQDATVFIEAIRNGAQGLDDLTNYVYAITNYWTNVTTHASGAVGYTNYPSFLTNGMNIVGLLSTPEYLDINGFPTNNLFSGGYSNHVVAYVRSISGTAIEKPPQNNDIVREGSFGYRLLCVNAPVATDMTGVTNYVGVITNAWFSQRDANLHELRLSFFWPLTPNGGVGPGRQTFRTLVAGQVLTNIVAGQMLYFYQSQSFVSVNFTNAP